MAIATLTDSTKKEVRQSFNEVVNMSASQLASWLQTNESKSVGQTKDGDSESIGHKSGKHIIAILKKKASDLTDEDYAHMEKVISYVKRHNAQQPKHVADSNWAYSLKNWGHDPTGKK
jgi:histidyl-tRNA synthetase